MCELKLYSLNSSKLLLVRRDREIFYVQDYCLLYVLSYNPHDTVRDIKLKLQVTMLILCQMILLFDGKALKDSQELSECGVCNESTVILNMTLLRENKFFTRGLCVALNFEIQSEDSVSSIKTVIQKQKDIDLHGHEIVVIPLHGTGFTTIEDNKPLPYFQLRSPLYCIPKPWPHVLINVNNQLTGKTITVEAYPYHHRP